MIVYKELSSIEKDLGLTAKTLYAVSNSINKHYRTEKIIKSDGSYRELSIPDTQLKYIQRRIANILLSQMDISPFATAYKPGGSTKINALPHIGHHIVLKLDIRHFFNSILYSTVKESAFPLTKYSEQNRILLTMLCYYKDALPQGAPTSPAISNIIMHDFDNIVGTWCGKQNIVYTRYCDDMTFSGDFDPYVVKTFISAELRKYGFFLNENKTVIAGKGQKKIVTGIIVNEKLNIPVTYRRSLKQEIYYCKKFGLKEHLKHIDSTTGEEAYLRSLLGRVNYVLSIRSSDTEFADYQLWLKEELKKYSL